MSNHASQCMDCSLELGSAEPISKGVQSRQRSVCARACCLIKHAPTHISVPPGGCPFVKKELPHT